MNFQKDFAPKDTFTTTTQVDMPSIENREEKFKLRTNNMTKSEQALAEYRARWTSGNHNFDRTYLGSK